MQVTIRCKDDESTCCKMAYSTFSHLRVALAKAYNPLLGSMYSKQVRSVIKAGLFGYKFNDRTYEDISNLYMMASTESQMLIEFLQKPDTKASAGRQVCRTIIGLKKHFYESDTNEIRVTIPKSVKLVLKDFFKVIEHAVNCGISWS